MLQRGRRQHTHPLTLHLNTIHELFEPVQHDPFHTHYRLVSGIDEIAAYLKSEGRDVKLHVIIMLPPNDQPSAELQQATLKAVERYCDVRIQRLRRDYATRRHNVIRSLQIGVGILAASLGLATLITNSPHISDGLRNLLSNALSIFGTVALWSPADAFLFGLRPMAVEQRTYEAIRTSTFEIQYASTTSPER